jgi:hypothetical protein
MAQFAKFPEPMRVKIQAPAEGVQYMANDMDKLNAFIGRFVGDLGAAVGAAMVVIGERIGLYKALALHPMTSAELAAKTKTDERYVREWPRRRRRYAGCGN